MKKVQLPSSYSKDRGQGNREKTGRLYSLRDDSKSIQLPDAGGAGLHPRGKTIPSPADKYVSPVPSMDTIGRCVRAGYRDSACLSLLPPARTHIFPHSDINRRHILHMVGDERRLDNPHRHTNFAQRPAAAFSRPHKFLLNDRHKSC